MIMKLQDFYTNLLKETCPFIEETIETPPDKLVDNIKSLLEISSDEYNLKEFLEASNGLLFSGKLRLKKYTPF